MNFRPRHISEDDFKQLEQRVQGMPRGGSQGHGIRVNNHSVGDLLKSSPYNGYRSKLELNWANYLDVLKAVKDIDGWAYEPLRFKLPGERNYYKIDFSAWKNGGVTFYELKGWNQSDSRSLVKLKTAAGLNPWGKFVLVKNHDGIWDEQVIR